MKRIQLFVAASAGLLAVAAAAHAQTIDYYRFEDGTPGSAATTLTDTGSMGRNGAVLAGASAPTYSNDVPVTKIPQTGAPNAVSLAVSSTAAASFNYPFPFQTLKSATLELWINPSSFPNENDVLWTTTAVNSGDANRFNVFLKASSGVPGIDYREPNGTLHSLYNASIGLPANAWSYLAYVKSGNTYAIYLSSSATGGKLKLISKVKDAAPNLPTSTGWTINGRFIEENLNCCQFAGSIDELRLSGAALKPSAFLVHKPTT